LTSFLFFEMDARIKDIIDQARSVFPNRNFRDASEVYDHGEWGLALAPVFFHFRRFPERSRSGLYKRLLSATDMGLFDASYYDAIKPTGLDAID
jgi:hypothetical protein